MRSDKTNSLVFLLALSLTVLMFFFSTNSYASPDKQSTATLTMQRYGPTSDTETLWSIASKVKKEGNYRADIYQILVVIYRQNPTAFADNSIHGLIPKSQLSIPSDKQALQINSQQAKDLLEKPTKSKVKTKSNVSTASTQKISKTTNKHASSNLKSASNEIEQDIAQLQKHNQQLKLQMTNIQHQIMSLKDQLKAEEQIQTQLKTVIAEQKQTIQVQQQQQTKESHRLSNNDDDSPSLLTFILGFISIAIGLTFLFFIYINYKRKRILRVNEEKKRLLQDQDSEF
ncbi:hypothetical protein L0B53_17595 [Vibrio sp. SS-MA-C1-2]|uniref:FimV/HubP family polar landmark protein n=1 Tax=Vibrio sp. SS-MA-C1-2 TaxID=2908646 RepID=UPI001F3488F6|nr:FimV/HubP family polar landmark protein [Vibrio sp. SS-MA-C1-2]UJF18779.1 hypothetical protein L0B53_17595 [Vibrio sp. SS-MA-C1-2]